MKSLCAPTADSRRGGTPNSNGMVRHGMKEIARRVPLRAISFSPQCPPGAPRVEGCMRAAVKRSRPIRIKAKAQDQRGATPFFRRCIEAASFSTSVRRTSLIRRSNLYSFVSNEPSFRDDPPLDIMAIRSPVVRDVIASWQNVQEMLAVRRAGTSTVRSRSPAARWRPRVRSNATTITWATVKAGMP